MSLITRRSNKELLQLFTDAYHSGRFRTVVEKQWASNVLEVFSETDLEKQKRLVQEVLLNPLEQFITQSLQADQVLTALKAKEDPPLFCARAFRNGEPTYSCRDCALDRTCVFCMQCFERSAHKKHKYRINSSGGGGYCDCGDTDAWKSDPACEIHDKASLANQKSPLDHLPVGMKERAEIVFVTALSYAYDMLNEMTELPAHLRRAEIDEQDLYCTMLLNDEIHTYDQVITILRRAVQNLGKKEAVDFATTVDREGRACVYTGAKDSCTEVANTIQLKTRVPASLNKPLQVQVLHYAVVCHQEFARSVLKWLESVITTSDALRMVFCETAMSSPGQGCLSLLEKILVADTHFWKAIRQQSHQLFMASVFKDLTNKTQFAILFTKHYQSIYKDFVKDDHYRSVSATGTTVQIYTVTTIAKVLIAEHQLIEVILNTILDESQAWCNFDGVLEFQNRDNSNRERYSIFKRVLFALDDLKYAIGCALSCIEWTDELREAFLHGFQTFLTFLAQIQEMDAVKRLVAQHIEFEREWETAFNLQLKLHDAISLFIRWCASDKQLLYSAIQPVLRLINVSKGKTKARLSTATVTVVGHSAECYSMEIGGSDSFVSVHIPLHRLLAGLCTYLYTDSITSHHFSPLIDEVGLMYLLEKPLAVQVLNAQMQADMWKRNGYSILNQLYHYQSVRLRQEMYDRDIQLIQLVASNMDPNQFMVHILNKFNLTPVMDERFDQPGFSGMSLKQTTVVMDELLNLLIILLGERYVPGVGQVDRCEIIQREIIHQLAITKMPHSDLDKNLPTDPNRETELEDNVLIVADFHRKGTGKGIYSLKAAHATKYNPCFYHYTKSEQSKSEDYQRSLRKAANQNLALPIPMPPNWAPLYKNISSLFTCDVLLNLMVTVLQRMAAKRSRSRSEIHSEKVLHLITLALHEDKLNFKQGDKSLRFVQAAQKKLGSFSTSLLGLLEELKHSPQITHEPVKDLLQHVLAYFSSVANLNQDVDVSMQEGSDSTSESAQDRERQRRAAKASKSRDKLIEKMARMQKKFLKDNSALFEGYAVDSSLKSSASNMSIDYVDEPLESPVALGCKQSSVQSHTENYVCILCQESSMANDGRTVVYSAYIQRSTVCSQNKSADWESWTKTDCLFMPADLRMGSFATTCGHPMHASCWQSYFESVLAKEQSRAHRLFHGFAPHSAFDAEKSEFLCPLCEAIANTVLPVLPSFSELRPDKLVPATEVSLPNWLDAMTQLILPKDDSIEDNCPLPEMAKIATSTMYTNLMELYEYLAAPNETSFSEVLKEMMMKFALNNYSRVCNTVTIHRWEHFVEECSRRRASNAESKKLAPMIWNTTAYTIRVLEQVLRSDGKPLFGHLSQRQEKCISLLVRFSSVCHQVLPLDTIKAHCFRLLECLLLPGGATKANDDTEQFTDITSFDAWHYLVSLCFSMSSLFADSKSAFPMGSTNDQYILHLVFCSHIVQVLLAYVPNDTQNETTPNSLGDLDAMDTDESFSESLLHVYEVIHQNLSISVPALPSKKALEAHVIDACLPFLRCAAILFQNMTDVPAPPACHTLQSPAEEFLILCNYLALPPSPEQLFTEKMIHLVHCWCANPAVMQSIISRVKSQLTVQYPIAINQLVTLPLDYTELINSASTFTCPNSTGSDESRTPTLCLVCGEMLCSQSYCCQVEEGERSAVGAVTAHSKTCGAGSGLYLRVRQCQILLLLGKTRGCFMSAPYIDDYGETDVLLRRGNPLHLCEMTYRDLHRLWLGHGIPEKVSRTLASNSAQNAMALLLHL